MGQRVTVEGTRSPGINPLNLDVTSVVPAGEPGDGGEITATFELAVECEPPVGTTFFAGASQQTAGLYDPDGDGTYTGSLTLPEGFYDPGAFEVPVAILVGSPEVPNQQTIKYFGEMVLEDGDAFSASVSFCDDGTGGTDGGVVSGDTNDDKSGGSVFEQGSAPSAKVLPATGGILPIAAAAGTLLLVGGLVARRIFR